MTMISMKEYATSKGITYEAVRKQVSRYRSELDGHIVNKGKAQFLDEEAVAFLDGKRDGSPIILLERSKDEEIDRLTEENKALLVKLATVQDQLIEAMPKIAQAEQSQLLLEAKEAASEAQKAQIESQQEQIARLEEEARKAEQARQEAEAKLERMKSRSLWARLTNRDE